MKHLRPKQIVQSFADAKAAWRSQYTGEPHASYQAAKDSRYGRKRSDLPPMGGTADYHFRSEADYLRIIEKSRSLDRDDAVISQMIDRAVANIIGDGFVVHPETGNTELDNYLWEHWTRWASDPMQCDAAQRFTFAEIEALVCRAMLVDGDCWLVMVEGPSGQAAVQLIEADQVQTPRGAAEKVAAGNAIALGVEMTPERQPVAIHIQQRSVNPAKAATATDSVRYEILDEFGDNQIFQAIKAFRPTQTRGVPPLAHCMELCGMVEDINFAKLVQLQITSCIAFIREKPAVTGAGPSGLPSTGTSDPGYGNQGTEITASGQTRLTDDVAPGMELNPLPGERVTGFSPQIPNPGYFEFAKLVLQMIGLNIGLPYVQMMMDASETNFSGWRGAVSEARKGHRAYQMAIGTRCTSGVYRFKIRELLETDPIAKRLAAQPDVIDPLAHRVNMPAARYIQPEIEAQADLLRVRNGLISPTQLHAEQQRDYEDVMTQSIRDNSLAIETAIKAAQKLSAATGEQVHWRELLALPMAEGTSIALQTINHDQSKRGTNDQNASD